MYCDYKLAKEKEDPTSYKLSCFFVCLFFHPAHHYAGCYCKLTNNYFLESCPDFTRFLFGDMRFPC